VSKNTELAALKKHRSNKQQGGC